MQFGHFDDTRREYVITTPETPLPWINYLGMESFFGLISHTGGGYCFYRDPRYRRILRYRYNNIPADNGGRYFYIKDGDTMWNPGWMPVKTALDDYACRHGLGYTRITGELNGLRASVLYFVPLNANAEVHHVRLENRSGKAKNIDLFSFVEFCLWDALADNTNFQRNLSVGEVLVDKRAIYHITEYRERRNHMAFYAVNEKPDGFDTDRDAFLGAYRGLHEPVAVERGASTDSMAAGWAPVASHHFRIELAPGASRDLIFTLGYAENPADEKYTADGVISRDRAEALQSQFQTAEQVDAAMDELRAQWLKLLAPYQLESSDEKLNRMVNIWNPYQCMVTFNMSRSASYYESGIGRGMGFRDSNQDLLSFVHQAPERARERILDIASTQFESGGNWHQYQPLTKKGNADAGADFNDDPLWLILAVAAYIKETGDWEILDESAPFDDTGKAVSLFEHCKTSFYYTVNNRGSHDLPLIGRADWNDCLNLNSFSTNPDESFQSGSAEPGRVAESVLIAGMFVAIGSDFIDLCRRTGRDEEADKAQKHIDAMRKAVCEHGWDGEWFLRAYDAEGEPVGSHANDEGQIYIEPQGYCVMAGIGHDNGYAERALNSVKERLDTEYGIVILNPPYSRYRLNLGEVTSYPPGYKENAGIFCHNNPWIVIAEAMTGRSDRAWEYYRKICPAYVEGISDIHRTEPYVYAQMIAGKDAVRPGEAKNSWLTGTAAWNYVAVSQYLLGIKPDWNGLSIHPRLPSDIDGFRVTRIYRGTEYRIEVKRDASLASLEWTVNGESVDGPVIAHRDSTEPVMVVCRVP